MASKEINSVAEAVPVIMKARGYAYYDVCPGCSQYPCIKNYHKTMKSGGDWDCRRKTPEQATAECCSLDVLAKEVHVKLPTYLHVSYSQLTYPHKSNEWFFAIASGDCDSEHSDFYTAESKVLGEAACIATARALVALKEGANGA